MATAVHIPASEVSDVNPLLDMTKDGAVILERDGESYRLIRQPGRTAAETLADPTIQWSNVALDEHWAKDMQAIYEETRREVQGRTAEEAADLMKTLPGADVEVDENWAHDMEAILALRHAVPDRDPWA